jgi:hypothetical protein
MKRIFLLVLVLSMFAGSVNGESNETDTNGEPTKPSARRYNVDTTTEQRKNWPSKLK